MHRVSTSQTKRTRLHMDHISEDLLDLLLELGTRTTWRNRKAKQSQLSTKRIGDSLTINGPRMQIKPTNYRPLKFFLSHLYVWLKQYLTQSFPIGSSCALLPRFLAISLLLKIITPTSQFTSRPFLLSFLQKTNHSVLHHYSLLPFSSNFSLWIFQFLSLTQTQNHGYDHDN